MHIISYICLKSIYINLIKLPHSVENKGRKVECGTVFIQYKKGGKKMKFKKTKQLSALIMAIMLSFSVMVPTQAANDDVASGGAITVTDDNDDSDESLFDRVIDGITSTAKSVASTLFGTSDTKKNEKISENKIVPLAAGPTTPVNPSEDGEKPTVTITGGTQDLNPLEVKAYQILQEAKYATGQTVYEVTGDFVNFFADAKTDYAGLTSKNTFYVYLGSSTEAGVKSVLRISSTEPNGVVSLKVTGLPTGDDGDEIDQSANLDEKFFGASLLEHMLVTNENIQKVSDWARKYVVDNGVGSSVTKKAEKGDTSIELTMPKYGYWMLLSSGAPTGIANVKTILKLVKNTDAEIDLKHEKQGFEKNVKNITTGGETDLGYGEAATGSGNDVIGYKVEFDLQDLKDYDPSKNYKFSLSDTMKNQKLIDDSFEVTFAWPGNDGKDHSVTFSGKDEVVKKLLKYKNFIGAYNETTNSQHFVMSFAIQKLKNIKCKEDGAKITDLQRTLENNSITEKISVTVKYRAILQDCAEWKNENAARWNYTNDPNVDTDETTYNPNDHKDPENPNDPEDPEDPDDPDDPDNPDEPVDPNDPKSPFEDKTTVYSYGIQIQKDFSDYRTDLYDDVVFYLYEKGKVADGKELKFVANSKGDYSKAEADDQYTAEGSKKPTIELCLDDNGHLNLYGLNLGDYVLVEAETPAGYSAAENINISITKDNLYAIEENYEAVDEDGTVLTSTNFIHQEPVNHEWITFHVLNQKGFKLPDTGKMGVWLLGIFGVLLLASAGYAYRSLKKKGMI